MPTKGVLRVEEDADTRDILKTMPGFSDVESVGVPDADSALRLMVRAIIANAQGEYSAAEVARVKHALEHHRETLRRVLVEVHRAKVKGRELKMTGRD